MITNDKAFRKIIYKSEICLVDGLPYIDDERIDYEFFSCLVRLKLIECSGGNWNEFEKYFVLDENYYTNNTIHLNMIELSLDAKLNDIYNYKNDVFLIKEAFDKVKMNLLRKAKLQKLKNYKE
jgi:hypothetical protein